MGTGQASNLEEGTIWGDPVEPLTGPGKKNPQIGWAEKREKREDDKRPTSRNKGAREGGKKHPVSRGKKDNGLKPPSMERWRGD